ncbi:MAG TPA: Crp/Fnr family transcriptional regulator [Burkholderiaceae bacterium]
MSEQTKELPNLHTGSAMMPAPEQMPVPAALKPRLVKVSQINFRKIPLLADLTDEELGKLQADLRIRKFSRREVVLQKGAIGDSLLFVLIGQLQVVDVTEDGRAIGLRMLAPGDFFGEIAVINGTTRSASVLALGESLVGFLPSAMALHLFSHSPSVARLMLRHLAEKIHRDSEFRALLSIHNTSRRIFTFLQMFRKTLPNGVEVIDGLPTHQDIANMINTSRETVTRAILFLVQHGIAEKDTHRLVLRKPAEFQNLLRGNPA